MTPERLLQRDQPLQPGRRLRFSFTLSYVVPLDEDILQGEPSATLEEIEEWFGGSPEEIWQSIRRNYDLGEVDHTVTLVDVGPEELRFEYPWEAQDRDSWSLSRVWLEIPPPRL